VGYARELLIEGPHERGSHGLQHSSDRGVVNGPYYLGAIDSPRLTRGELTHRDWDYPYGTGVTTSTGCHDDALLTMHLFEDHTPVIAHKHCQ